MKEYNTNGRVLHNVAGSFYTGNPNSEQRRFPLNRTGVWTSTGLHSQSRSFRINSCFVDMQKKAPVSLGKKTLCLTLSVVVLSRWPRKPSSDHSRPPRGVWILDGYHGLWQIIVVLLNRIFCASYWSGRRWSTSVGRVWREPCHPFSRLPSS
jgi:hypothetical protein